MLLHYYLPGWPKKLLWDKQPKEIVGILRESSIDMIYFDVKGVEGYVMYDSAEGVQHPIYRNTQIMSELIEECHGNDIAIGAYYIVGWENLSGKLNPDWLVKTASGKPVRVECWPLDILCINSPFRDVAMTQIAEIVDRYDFDGLWLDEPCFEESSGEDPTCYCPFCQQKFRSRFGSAIPQKDWSSELWRTFVRWREESVERFLEEVWDLVKARDPELPITFNGTTALPRVSWTMGVCGERAFRYTDFASVEVYPEVDGYARPYIWPKLARAMAAAADSHAKELEVIGTRYRGIPYDGSFRNRATMEWEIATAMSSGAHYMFTDMPYPDGNIERSFYREIGEIYREAGEKTPYLGGEPLEFAAVAYSHTTRLLSARDDADARYTESFCGTCKALAEAEAHVPWSCIVEADLSDSERLGRYPVVVLPDVVCLSDHQVEAIAEYVKGGGGLVATYRTSLWDAEGRARSDFGLSEVLGCSYHDLFEKDAGYVGLISDRDLSLGLPEHPHVHHGAFVKLKALGGAETDGTLFDSFHEGLSAYRYYGCMKATLGKETKWPALVKNRLGRGRTVTMPFMPGCNYEANGYEYFGRLLLNAVLWAAREDPAIVVHAPANVGVNCMRMDGGGGDGAYVVHLINFDAARTQPGKHAFLSDPRPVYGIRVAVRNQVKEARMVCPGQEVEKEVKKGITVLAIKELDSWGTLVIDVEDG